MKTSKNPTTSSNYLPPEVWAQILSTLPAKTLIQFRCVCKSWCSIIDNPDFAHIQAQINSENNASNKLLVALEGMGKFGDQGCLLTVRDAQTLRKIDHIFRINSHNYRLIGSCNGLLLVKKSGSTYNKEELRLWNPCIHKSLLLPTCPLRSRHFLFDGLSCYLLGCAPRSKDYKVVAFELDNSLGKGNEKMYFSVYTLSNRQWTVRNTFNTSNLNTNNTYGLFYYLSTAVFFRGAAYWLGNNDKRIDGLTHLASFDFDKENVTFLELPFSWDLNTVAFPFLLGESLAVFRISVATSSIWVLQQDNKKGPWTLWFSGKSNENGYQVFIKYCMVMGSCELRIFSQGCPSKLCLDSGASVDWCFVDDPGFRGSRLQYVELSHYGKLLISSKLQNYTAC
ncbi:F-box/kelch-repeat protein At3g23880-like [Silene latifolia]|uniref:F-box/kelch-repeat protein At3g23880-like n=1 Tax=Silene latifolia TaxID=37657 RepID=UPI003D76B398